MDSNRIDLYDGQGYVEFHSKYLSDQDIVEIARVSTGKGLKTPERDQAFIDYLWRHEHHSPFGFPSMTFKVKVPIFVARQLFRHRMAQINEYSGRYSEMVDEAYVPKLDRVTGQDQINKQGSGEPLDHRDALAFRAATEDEQEMLFEGYRESLGMGVSRELARINLPLSTFTIFYWQQDLRNLLHMLSLRMDSHAQEEVQEFAYAVYTFAKYHFPWTVEAFRNHTLQGTSFSWQELGAILKALDSFEYNDPYSLQETIWDYIQDWKKSHRREFLEKINRNTDNLMDFSNIEPIEKS